MLERAMRATFVERPMMASLFHEKRGASPKLRFFGHAARGRTSEKSSCVNSRWASAEFFGPLTAAAFRTTIDDSGGFKHSRAVGAHMVFLCGGRAPIAQKGV
jgi:transposase